ncbi:unnamed protein product [Albugo candida]|uniref:Uncharacterized protein n=1 Tax=Albugo candida TaxID=65357 RepID=A0A024GT86_9STRA|nr:unnamed protein product [Albugo candida]|eukprot:CCI49984.1 unnamed protein product [Albugo candida]
MLYARIPLVFLLCCILCVFQCSRCELKTQLWTLKSNGLTYLQILLNQRCILRVAGAMRATVSNVEKANPPGTIYTNVEFSVTGSDFAFMGLHSKCAFQDDCGGFISKGSSSPSVISTELSKLVEAEEEAAKREPLCLLLGLSKLTVQSRLCLKEVSRSNIMREYLVGSSEHQMMRTILHMYPRYYKTDPMKLIRPCLDFGGLKVDSSSYVSAVSCQKLLLQTSVANPPPPIERPLIDGLLTGAKDGPSTSQDNSEKPHIIDLTKTPRCIGVKFSIIKKDSDCMKSLLKQIEGEVVLLHKEDKTHYFYLYGSVLPKKVEIVSVENPIPSEDDKTLKKDNAALKKGKFFWQKDKDISKKDKTSSGEGKNAQKEEKEPFTIEEYGSLEKCKKYHSHKYDTSSIQLQILARKPEEFQKLILKDVSSQQTGCALAHHGRYVKNCLPCIDQHREHVTTNTMTDSTILVTMNDIFEKEKLASCIKDVHVRNDATKCSHFVFLPREMCEYAGMKTSAKSPSDASSSNHAQPNVMVVTWKALNIRCLQDIALYHNVLLVSMTDRYLWMLRLTSRELSKRCKEMRIEKEYFIDVHFLRSISAFDMKDFIGPT